jgi:SAM-dependent methyltransferase
MNVLDFGCGTGIVSEYIAPHVNLVVAVDTCAEMLDRFTTNQTNIIKYIGTSKTISRETKFDVIIARMVFHHLKNPIEVLEDLNSLLKENGMLIIQENGVSINPHVNTWFHGMMQLKEHRYYISEEMLRHHLNAAGFYGIESYYHKSRNFSVMNWLRNTETSEIKIQYLFDIHNNMQDEMKKEYNFRRIGNDILLDTECLFVFGTKINWRNS